MVDDLLFHPSTSVFPLWHYDRVAKVCHFGVMTKLHCSESRKGVTSMTA